MWGASSSLQSWESVEDMGYEVEWHAAPVRQNQTQLTGQAQDSINAESDYYINAKFRNVFC
jgi:hypothetical protein